TATTNEIARSVADASVGAADIAESVNGVAERARDNSTGAQEVRFASDELARMASELQTLVEGFRI
ncbi:MAG: methyl-accepting chemotaxis protein, partial [Planctomycetota bacterium]